ncbi:MAG: cytochrome c [Gammaproteobacteria bacterium]|nr:cytochrome c [Gammaproteobacteria bacterium]
MVFKLSFSLFLFLLVSACDGENTNAGLPVPNAPPRQLDATQLALGKQVFQNSCALCHGAMAEGAANWRKKDADGFYPAPPLNGSGHAWHHSTEVLSSVINNGSVKGQGKMPAWNGKLSEQEIKAVIVWFQSKWPQPVYDAWFEMQQRGR